MAKMKWLDWTATVLVLVGGINWGLVGIFNYNLVQSLLGYGILSNIIYVAVGLSAGYSAYRLFWG